MKQLLYLTLFTSICTFSQAQQFWVKPKKVNDEWCLADHTSQVTYFCSDTIHFQNFNPIWSLKTNQLKIDLQEQQMLTIYSLFKTPKNSAEQFIWGIEEEKNQTKILTNYRYADLREGKFLNFIDHVPGSFYISGFLDQEVSALQTSFTLGGKPIRKDLPVVSCEALLGECIGFDQVLSPIAKNILETSLALKYSVTLDPFSNYILSPDQEPLWDATSNRAFHHHVAGIAKNKAYGLYQKQSQSKLNEGYLSIGLSEIKETNELNQEEFEKNQSLVWGDTNDQLLFVESNEGMPYLDRKWKIENTNFVNENFQVSIDEKAILHQIPEDHKLWMKIKQNNASKRYCVTIDGFKNVQFFDGSQELSFLHAPEKWMDVEIGKAHCNEGILARIKVDFIGIEAPFRFELVHLHSDKKIYNNVLSENTIELNGLEVGQYRLSVTVQGESAFSQQINIEDTAIPELQIQRHFVFDKKDDKTVDASFGIEGNWEYEWITPEQKIILGSVISLDEDGLYWLKMFNEHCNSEYAIHSNILANNISSMGIFPNPSPDGYFNLKIELENIYPTEIYIQNILGQSIEKRRYTNALMINDTFYVRQNGVYLVTVKSGSSTITKKLIIQQP